MIAFLRRPVRKSAEPIEPKVNRDPIDDETVDGRFERLHPGPYPARRVVNRTGAAKSEIYFTGESSPNPYAIAKVGARTAFYESAWAVNLHVDLGPREGRDVCALTIGDRGVEARVTCHWDALVELAKVITELAAWQPPDEPASDGGTS